MRWSAFQSESKPRVSASCAISTRSLQRAVAPPISRSVSGRIRPTLSGRFRSADSGRPTLLVGACAIVRYPFTFSVIPYDLQQFCQPAPRLPPMHWFWRSRRNGLNQDLPEAIGDGLRLAAIGSSRDRIEGWGDVDTQRRATPEVERSGEANRE